MADSADLSSNTFTVKAETARQHFYERIAASVTAYEQFFTIKTDQREMTSFQPVDIRGIGSYTTQAATGDVPAADDLTAGGSAYTAPAYEKRLTLTEYQIAKNPGILMDAAAEFAEAAAYTISSVAYGLVAAAPTTVHPDTSYTEGGGGTVYLADVFATPVSQANLITAALASAGLQSARQVLRAYKNKDGRVVDYATDDLFLLIPAALEQDAVNLGFTDLRTYDGSGLADVVGNIFNGYVVNPHATDANDWALVSRQRNPFGLWLPKRPELRMNIKPGAGRVELYGSFECGAFVKPFEGGFCFSQVA